MFARKYSRIAEKVPEVVFLDVIGDENDNTRRMMIQQKVKATPTFQLYRGGELVDTVTGTNDKKLTREVVTHMTPEEQAAHPEEMALLAAGTTSEEDAEELAAATH
jgi:thioredoxin-like negative regulator of GroEL